MKQYFLNILIFVLFSLQVQAQNSRFSIKVTQVYPVNNVIYGNTYNLSSEVESAEKKLRNQFTGKNANYVMEVIKFGKKETKTIHNINWIMIENSKKTNHKDKPVLKAYYNESTVVEYYACDIYGKQKSDYEKFEYDCYYCFMKGSISLCKGNDTLYTFADCLKKAIEYFTANRVDTVLCMVKIYDSKGNVVDSANSNRMAYTQYLAALAEQKRIADSVQIAKIEEMKKHEKLRNDNDSIKMANSNVYDKHRVGKRLRQLLERANTLQKGQTDLLSNMQIIINEAIIIVEILEVDQTAFDRNQYFGTADLYDLRRGLNKLLELNKKKAEKNKSKTEKQSKKQKNKE